MLEDSTGVCTCDGASVGAESWMGHRQVDVTQKKTQHSSDYNREYESEAVRHPQQCLWLTGGHTEYQMM